MSKNNIVLKDKEVRGKVIKVNQGSSNLDIETEQGYRITAYIAGKLRKNKIKVLEGDTVIVEIAKSDLSRGVISRGRIVKRIKQSDL
jgi:translation initiation factor IF-1|tara:strand:- start:214 stop:474 length:261 start_codon:yes stop_codon:yes gene_type:complete